MLALVRGSRTLRPGHRGFGHLPSVDISPFLGGAGCRQAAAADLDRACREVGFFYLEGHGVPEEEIRQLHSQARDFFALPQTQKEAIAISSAPASGRGYQRVGENVTQGLSDWHEAIDFYAEPKRGSVDFATFEKSPANLEASSIEKIRLFVEGQNQWPAEPREFRQTVERHIGHASRIGDALMEAMCVALSLPESYFRGTTDKSFWNTRVIGYPALPAGHPGLSVGEHTDYGCWTILSQDDTPGALEVRQADGTWGKAEPRAGRFVINLGDMLSVWTKGRYVATPHRVRQTRGNFRTSIAFFHEPNFDALICPLDIDDGPARAGLEGSTAPLDRALRGGSLLYGEHVHAKVSSNFVFAE
eukprot:TRINITY_DN34809_c0_g1_i1.p1 TRINITY_DN34809_c0_g1~~TRINITY_DN34809_c0_g1_i1.p1  ORF type:complete len:360 (-),score=44.78 TRINITY_DN34809_c0_g1_i1:411-1490(-)